MLNLQLYTSFCFLAALISFTPGPNVLLMIKYGLEYKLKEAVFPIPGIALALLTYAVLVALGLSKILSKYPQLFHIIHILGACYLISIGLLGLFKQLRHKIIQLPSLQNQKACRLKLFSSGYICALTNPKILILYLILIPQFIDKSLNALPQFLFLGLTHILLVILSMTTYCILANQCQSYLKKYSRIQSIITHLILIGLGFFLILKSLHEQ